MDQTVKDKVLTQYASTVAQLEVAFINYTNNDILTNDIHIETLYGGDINLRNQHKRLVTYMGSTMVRFVISRTIVSDYYAKNLCILSSLEKRTTFTRNAISQVIKTSVAEGWVYKKVNPMNNKETLILPTGIRIKLWEVYALGRFFAHDKSDITKSHNLLKALHL